MGDGQHVWAAAEWVMMIKNCFIREEEEEKLLILCSGIPQHWIEPGKEISFGPVLTPFGKVFVLVCAGHDKVTVEWKAEWFADEPVVDICLRGFSRVTAARGQTSVYLERGGIQ